MLLYFLLIKKKYNILKPDYATGFKLNCCWFFGYSYNAIVVKDNCTSKGSSYVYNGTYDIKEQYELNGGEQYFTVESFEIYQVNY